ncbi:golgi uridine diphosphate-N- acetylglucosamine transporter [Serendipita sp. 411]|nr:golgi uridine diphosphate-N- acetylglucosamine transporter [Serendipita sp. 411]
MRSSSRRKEISKKVENGENGHYNVSKNSAPSYFMTLALVFGGCCSNAWSLERLLMHDSNIGSALTFLQLSFVMLYYLPSVLHFPQDVAYTRWFPRLDTRVVPLQLWSLQVIVLLGVNIFNNWTFIYKIPLTLQIIFRSSGLAVSMIFGYLFLDKRYNRQQILAVIMVSCGVCIATLSRPTSRTSMQDDYDPVAYVKGIFVMALSLILSGILGTLQEKTFRQYGSFVWKEGLFYTHALALPCLLMISRDIPSGLKSLSSHGVSTRKSIPEIYVVVFMNVITQACCISGVNRLGSTVSSVQTNLLLTARKAASLVISILLLGSGWNVGLMVGAVLVSAGTILYSWRRNSPVNDAKKDL